MKKYVLLPIFIFILFGFSYAQLPGGCTTDADCGQGGLCNIQRPLTQGTCSNTTNQCAGCTELQIPQICNADTQEQKTCNNIPYCCPKENTGGTGASTCTGGSIINGQCIVNNAGNMGIEMSPDCLINGQCKFDIYQTLGIRQSLPKDTRSSPGIFIQDVILSATFFVGTLITGVLIISGLLFVFSGVNAGLADKAKKGITGSLIGLLFVVGSYAFVRLIQFLVTGGGG